MPISSENLKILENLIKKINNRCNPEKYSSFSELCEKVKETTYNSRSSFLTENELEFIKSNPEIENNILKLCIKQREKENKDTKFTVSNILDILLLTEQSTEVYNNKLKQYENPKIGINFLNDPNSKSIHGTIEEILIMLDLSVVPYR